MHPYTILVEIFQVFIGNLSRFYATDYGMDLSENYSMPKE
jgi:hypothetical protein